MFSILESGAFLWPHRPPDPWSRGADWRASSSAAWVLLQDQKWGGSPGASQSIGTGSTGIWNRDRQRTMLQHASPVPCVLGVVATCRPQDYLIQGQGATVQVREDGVCSVAVYKTRLHQNIVPVLRAWNRAEQQADSTGFSWWCRATTLPSYSRADVHCVFFPIQSPSTPAMPAPTASSPSRGWTATAPRTSTSARASSTARAPATTSRAPSTCPPRAPSTPATVAARTPTATTASSN